MRKLKKVISLLLGGLVLSSSYSFIGIKNKEPLVVSYNTDNNYEIINREKRSATKIDKKINNANGKQKYFVSNTYDAYTQNKYVYVPYSVGKYEEYYVGNDIDPIYDNERSYFEIFDNRRNWSSTKYKENEINGNLYEYNGEYRNKYFINTRTLHRYKRDYYKTVKMKSYETQYNHRYRGNKWWNILLTKSFLSKEKYNYPRYDNYSYLGYEEKRVCIAQWDEKVLDRSETTDWRTSAPFRLFGIGPEWYTYDTKQEYSLGFERVLKWNPNATQYYKCLQPIYIYDNNFVGLHLSQWNDVSNLKDKTLKNVSFEERTDYIYISCEKLIKDIYKSVDHIIDVYKDEMYEKILKQGEINFWSELACGILSGVLNFVPKLEPVTMVISIMLLIDSINNYISFRKDEKRRLEGIKQSGYKVFEKLTEDNLKKYKYCVFKINQYGLDLDFFDEINNSYDNTKEISLSYKANEKINGSISSFSDKKFSSIYGYPILFNSLDYLYETTLSIFRKEKPRISDDLNDLVRNGTYSYL